MLIHISTTDDNALRNKVNEAVAVYDEYVKSRDQTDGAGPNEAEAAKPKSDDENES